MRNRNEQPAPEQGVLIPTASEGAEPTELKSWALVEIFGHQRMVGFLSQQAFGSGVLFRVDVPDLTSSGKVIRAGFTRYLGLAAIYSITPITEEMVRKLLPSIDGVPGEARSLSYKTYARDEEC